ncbi:DUF6056 family protein [Helicobacter cinaedi]|uniref:DUF6056 family protein n=1 Tax=Helicobacter cinaedi TaxID=213 RepID=UPI001F3FBBD5|nr:DUF6056 family protein [Helicobacter cinaedi]
MDRVFTQKSVYWFFGILLLYLLVLNALFPTQSDDLGYGVNGFSGMLSSYNNWNGRFFEMLRHGFVAAIAPSVYFVAINAVIGVLFFLSFFVFVFGRLPRTLNDVIFLCIVFLFILHYGAFGSIFLWAAGSLNYLWAYVALLLGFLPYRLYWGRYFQGKRGKELYKSQGALLEILKALGMLALCFVGGMSSEAVGIVALLIHIGFLGFGVIKSVKEDVKLPLWYFAGVIALGVGWFMLYSSPGHAKRAELFKTWGGFYSLSDIWAMSFGEKINLISGKYANFISHASIIFIVSSLLFVFNCNHFKRRKLWIACMILCVVLISVLIKNHKRFFPGFEHNYLGLFYFLMVFLLLLLAVRFYHREHNEPMKRLFIKFLLLFVLYGIFVGTTIQVGIPDRARLMFVLITAIMVAFVYQHWSVMNGEKIKKYNKWIVVLVCGYSLFVLSAYIDGRLKWERMLDSIQEQKLQGKEEIVVSAKTFTSFYRKYGDWGNPGEDPSVWPNTTYAHYYGVKSFVAK